MTVKLTTPITKIVHLSLTVLLVLLITNFTSCERGQDRQTQGDREDLARGSLVYADSFSGENPGEEWQSGFAGWQVQDGLVTVQGARNDALWLTLPLPEHFRITFTARSDSPEGDLKFEVLGDGIHHESGYVGIFGGWRNRLNIIARLDEHGDDRLIGAPGHKVEPGKTYNMAVIRTDQRLRWYIDGSLFLSYDDRAPLRGDGHQYFGFNNWETPVAFGDLRIFDLGHADSK